MKVKEVKPKYNDIEILIFFSKDVVKIYRTAQKWSKVKKTYGSYNVIRMNNFDDTKTTSLSISRYITHLN